MAEPIIKTMTLSVVLSIIDQLQSVPGATGATVNNNKFNVSKSLNPTSTPPASKDSFQELTVGGGGTTDVDLTALPSTQGTINGTGLKLQALFVINTGVTALTVGPGATNEYEPFGAGNEVDLPAGSFMLLYVPDQLPDVAAGEKLIRFTGTAAATFKVAAVLG